MSIGVFQYSFIYKNRRQPGSCLRSSPLDTKAAIPKILAFPVPHAWRPDKTFCVILTYFFFLSLSLLLSCSRFFSFWKIELLFLLKMCFELNAQLHNSCYITCRLVLWSCPDSCVLLLSSTLSIAVCAFKHWFIWCAGSVVSLLLCSPLILFYWIIT